MWPVRQRMTMTANLPAAPASDGPRMPSAESTETRSEAFAVSPAIGPLPAIYVPPSPSQATAPGLLWRATAGRAAGPSATCRDTP